MYGDELTAAGLQTPRLKRLAEIVSAQAIAQQEKLDYEEAELVEADEEGEVEDKAIEAAA